eukprot:CAMPEP_0175387968 /NCGR_PEP_ID=MMETSP0095-20121207/30140_1 /TAXON_ID=311494 /ORGANISM="Alexandrium monilatum, Strain CCMP3105" /LENGTH=328 /DNA_ID=CAMNT_0016686451 /DNA_START=1 /DNA_END=987 /DNA_ORIENTATION=+
MARGVLGIIAALGALAGAHGEPSGPYGRQKAEPRGPAEPVTDDGGIEPKASCPANASTPECTGKAACLQLRLENAAHHVEELSAAVDDLLEIDRLAAKSSIGTKAEDKRRRELEAKLHQLETRIHNREANSTVDTKAIIKHLGADIRALNAREEHLLYEETRHFGEAARRSARDFQVAVRHTARRARGLAHRMERAGHDRRRCADAADVLSRRVESAADHIERKGEVLARRIDKAVQKRLSEEEAGLRRDPQGRQRGVARAANRTIANAPDARAFLERPDAPPRARGGALLPAAAVCAVCAGMPLAVLLARKTWRRAGDVSPPDSSLG